MMPTAVLGPVFTAVPKRPPGIDGSPQQRAKEKGA